MHLIVFPSNRVTCCPVCIIQSIQNSFFLFFNPEQKKVLVEVVMHILFYHVSIDGAIYCFTVENHFCHLPLLLGICCSVTHSLHQVLSVTERFHGGGFLGAVVGVLGSGSCAPLAPIGGGGCSRPAQQLPTHCRPACANIAAMLRNKVNQSGKDGAILKWFEGP